MVAAVSPLLGDGIHLRYLDREGETKSSYGLADGQLVDEDGRSTAIPDGTQEGLSDTPAILLTSNITGSAAEGLVVAFEGRSSTIHIGARTAGVPTGRADFELESGISLLYTEAAAAGRDGLPQVEAIEPDLRTSVILPTAHREAVQVARDRFGCE